jgi:hypothetical protein
MLGTKWAPNKDVQKQLLDFTSIVFSVSSAILRTDIICELKKMGIPMPVTVECVAVAAAASANQPAAPRTTCKQCGNELVDGKCRFVNHRAF